MRSLPSRLWQLLREATRRYFVAGVLVFAPIGVTIWAIAWIINRLDNLLLPKVLEWLMPGLQEPPRVPFVGAIFTFLVIIFVGIIARHFFGHELVRAWERLLSRVPVARSIYGGVKQLAEAIFAEQPSQKFNRVVLVEFPRKGMWAIAFTTGTTRGPAQHAIPERVVNCFIPTTPNPTSGFYLLVCEDEIRDVALTVEDAFKLVMSAGLVAPGDRSPVSAVGVPPPAELLGARESAAGGPTRTG
jgi:uncharacterized membrane protein